MNQEKIGNFIRKIRIENEMTQQELAEKIGVTDMWLNRLELNNSCSFNSFIFSIIWFFPKKIFFKCENYL